MLAYLDSSVVLRHVLLGEEPIRHALAFPRVVSSELIEIECRRVLHRCRLADELDDETLAAAHQRLDAVLAGIDLLLGAGGQRRPTLPRRRGSSRSRSASPNMLMPNTTMARHRPGQNANSGASSM